MRRLPRAGQDKKSGIFVRGGRKSKEATGWVTSFTEGNRSHLVSWVRVGKHSQRLSDYCRSGYAFADADVQGSYASYFSDCDHA